MKWALKIIAKIFMSRLPLSYGHWQSLGLFRHGRMDSIGYSVKIFDLHLNRAFPDGLPPDAVILELGPGDSLASALLGYANGASLTYLVDVGEFARRDIIFYQNLARYIANRGLESPDFSNTTSFDDIVKISRARYLTAGLSSLRSISSSSVDFIWSHSVLEHVRKNELPSFIAELKRILKPSSFSSHNVDYQDHLDLSLNNLRFSEKLWESDLFAKSGFYTNRVPAVCLHKMFKDVGFDILEEKFGKWPSLPIKRNAIHSEFQKFTDDQLINRTSHLLLRT
jgi:Methyltransferase domain